MPTRRKKLSKPAVHELIKQLTSEGTITTEQLFAFAEKVNGGPFAEPKAKKPKAISMAVAKNAVLAKFGCKNTTELRNNKTFSMSITGENISLRSTAGWMKLYRRWVAVPEEERGNTGPTCINGIDVLENFRPWHVFGLDSETATQEDVKSSFRNLAKIHHPDAGGNARVFERLQAMRDSVLALMK